MATSIALECFILVACGSSGPVTAVDAATEAPDAATPSDDGSVDAATAPDAAPTEDASSPIDAGELGPDAGTECITATPAGPNEVRTRHGVVRGASAAGVQSFWGIPFAAPPVGDRRWEAPADPECWTDVREAITPGPACPQLSFSQGPDGQDPGTYPDNASEDCLYLNVWTPDTNGPPRPVLFFIHGGGNQQGHTAHERLGTRITEGDLLAERTGSVVVTADYRLGPLGFMVHPELPGRGNYGLMDQIKALRWVQENIAAFGGDPTHVLLFGESAGALDTCLLLSSPEATGLFSAALMESGGCFADDLETASEWGVEYAEKLGCTGPSAGECLRRMSPEELVSKLAQPLEGGRVESPFGGVIDGTILPEHPRDRLAAGRHNHVPLVIGTNADETSATVPPGSVTPERMAQALLLYPREFRDELRALYPPGATAEEARNSYIRMTTDSQFVCGARRIARLVATSQTEPVFRYSFAHFVDAPVLRTYGAYHGLELFYVFQTIERSSVAAFIGPADRAVLESVRSYWRNFAATGTPNAASLVEWPSYDPAEDTYLEIAATPVARAGLRTDACDLWEAIALAQ